MESIRSKLVRPLSRAPGLVLLGVALLVLLGSGPASAELGTPIKTVTDTSGSPITTVAAGEVFEYRISYQCTSIVNDCSDAVMTDVLPAELATGAADIEVVGTADVASTSYDEGTRTATWTFNNPLAAGSSGVVTLRVKFPHGSTPDGTVATNSATLTGDGQNLPSAPVDVTAAATSDWTIDKTVDAGGALDQDVVFRIDVTSPGDTGGLNLTNAVVTDPLPPGAVFVSATNGGTESGGTVTWNLGTLSPGTTTRLYLTLRFPSSDPSNTVGTTKDNTSTLTGTPVGESQINIADTASLTLATANPGLFDTKRVNASNAAVGDTLQYRLQFRNEGNQQIDQLIVIDTLPIQVDAISVRGGLQESTIPTGGVSYTVEYETNAGGTGNWTTLTGSPFDTLSNINVTLPTLASGDYFTRIRWTYTNVPVGFDMTNFNAPRIDAIVIDPDNAGNTLAGPIINTVDYSGTIGGSVVLTSQDTATTTVQSLPAQPRVTKSLISVDGSTTSSAGVPGSVVRMQLQVNNRNTSTESLSDFVLADLLDPGYEYGGTWLVQTSGGCPDPSFAAIDNYNNTGRTLLRWTWQGATTCDLAPNGLLRIRFDARIKQGVEPGTLINWGAVVEPQLPDILIDWCRQGIQDVFDLNGNGDTLDLICASRDNQTDVTVGAAASLSSQKLVKGQLDADYHVQPDTGLTVQGGSLDYRLTVTNTGNVPLTNVVVVDILPFVGDTGIIDVGTARLTEWRPELIASVQAPSGVVVEYSTESNPCRPELGVTVPGCTGPSWSPNPPADITTVQSLRFSFGSLVLQPLDSFQLNWPMQAPLDAPFEGEIAWNSFGFVAENTQTGTNLPPTEPNKVGIAIQAPIPAEYGDRVWIDDNKNGIQDSGEVGLNGVRVRLYRYRGSGGQDPALDQLVGTRLTGNDGNGDPGFYLFADLPAGEYYARFTRPSGYEITTRNAPGSTPADDSDADPGTGLTAITDLTAGEIDLTWDMGVFPSTVAALGNYVWFDANADGIQNEPALNGINGVTVLLFDNTDPLNPQQVDSTTTADDVNGDPGYYQFDGLTPGTPYYVQFVLPTLPMGAQFTQQNAGTDPSLDSDANTTTGETDEITLASGQFDPDWDAGIVLPTGPLRLGNRVWIDSNNNGVYEPLAGEVGVDNLRLNLYVDDGDGVLDAGDSYYTATRTFTSNGPGFYNFVDLPSGDDWIVQVDSSAFAPGGPLAGLLPSTGSGQPPPDPDNNLDDDIDQNGYAEPNGDGAVSLPVTLTTGAEPADSGNYNPTLDFGFFELTCTQICDINADTAVDRTDLIGISRGRGTLVDPPGTANSGDCNADGILSVNDVRACRAFVTP